MATVKIIGPAYPYRGGIANTNERLAQEFISEGHKVSIETFTIQYPSILFPGKTQYHEGEAPEGLHISRTINSINPLNWFRVGHRIKKQNPDIVIIRYWLPFMAPCLGTIARQIGKNGHSQIVCLADNVVPHEKRPGDRQLTAYFLNSIHGLVAMSQTVLDDTFTFRKDLPVELTTHPLFDNYGCKIQRGEALSLLELDPSFRYFLFFGFIRDYKGLDILLEAFADKRLYKYPAKLIVAGEFYSKPDKYLKLISDLKLEEKVILKTEFIPNDQVNRFFCAADMIVQPYKSATQSGVTQIGYHFSKPMLVTNVGGLAEIIPHNKIGYVVEPTPEAITDSLVDFLENDRCSEFEQNTEIEKKKFSWDNMTKAIFRVVKKAYPNEAKA